MRRLIAPLLLLGAFLASALAATPSQAVVHQAGPAAAAQKAAVRSVLKQTPSALKGRLTSDRKSCVQDRDVYVLARQDGSPYPQVQYLATTNAKGRWKYPLMARRGVTFRLSAITLGGPTCQIAQSNQVPFDGVRSGSAARAGGLADVSITLLGSTADDARGQVTSSRDVCHEFRPVIGFARPEGTHGTFSAELISISKRNGRWKYNVDGSQPRLGGTDFDLVAVVPGTNNCRPAQSKLQTIDLG